MFNSFPELNKAKAHTKCNFLLVFGGGVYTKKGKAVFHSLLVGVVPPAGWLGFLPQDVLSMSYILNTKILCTT